jgi:pantoate--beta-alanine ligase
MNVDLPLNNLNVSVLQLSEAGEMAEYIAQWQKQGFSVGFVPTMGALHKGHTTLIEKAAENGQKVVCSIFVNPTQFNDPTDFERYPRIIEKDLEKLSHTPCNVVFTPSVSTVYPNGTAVHEKIDLQGIDERMEGAMRPGHFQGVVQVVKRLFELVPANHAYFGLKDYQQFLVIKKMTEVLNIPIAIHGIETVREKDGLAMSSRNALLTEEDRQLAPVIYAMLTEAAKRFANREPLAHIRILAEQRLSQLPGVKPEYFEIASANTLEPVYDYTGEPARIFTAAFFGKVRLIDNLPCN